MPSHSRPPQLTETLLQSTGGYELVFSALLLGLMGYGLDRWLETGPFLAIVFGVLGFLGASASLYFRYRNQVANLAEETA